MKTVFINGSPKKNFSASEYFLDVQRFFVKGNTIKEKLRNQSDYARILNTLSDADTVVFCLPLYVDGVPSHVLAFLKEMEHFCQANNLDLNIYVIANGGFSVELAPLAVGFIAAAVSGILAIKFLINLLNKNKFYIFSIYCGLVGIISVITSFIK